MKRVISIIVLLGMQISYGYPVQNQQENDSVQKNREINTHYFHDLAFVDVVTDSYKGKKGRTAKEIIIYKVSNSLELGSQVIPASPQKKLGEKIWTITPESLPVDERTCIHANIDSCEYNPNSGISLEGCYHSCVQYGPQFLAYDEKSKKLYILADTIEVGQAAGPFLGFVADIDKKEIKYLRVFFGFSTGSLSPSGKYLLNMGRSFIELYNTLDGDFTDVDLLNSKSKLVNEVYLGNVLWLNDKQFSYRTGVFDKNRKSFDLMKENIYDIPSKKMIKNRIMGKNEYNSVPYVESN